MNTYDQEQIIIKATQYFLDKIEDKEGHILKDINIPRIEEKSRDFLESTFNTLVKTHDTLEEKILPRSVGGLDKIVQQTIGNLKIIIQEIRQYDDSSMIVQADKNILYDSNISEQDKEVLQKIGKKVQSDSRILINAPKNFKFVKRDILKLTYYELANLYKRQSFANFKSKAIDKINFSFGINLRGDKLEISLTKIISLDGTNKLSISSDFHKKKLVFPTFTTTI